MNVLNSWESVQSFLSCVTGYTRTQQMLCQDIHTDQSHDKRFKLTLAILQVVIDGDFLTLQDHFRLCSVSNDPIFRISIGDPKKLRVPNLVFNTGPPNYRSVPLRALRVVVCRALTTIDIRWHSNSDPDLSEICQALTPNTARAICIPTLWEGTTFLPKYFPEARILAADVIDDSKRPFDAFRTHSLFFEAVLVRVLRIDIMHQLFEYIQARCVIWTPDDEIHDGWLSIVENVLQSIPKVGRSFVAYTSFGTLSDVRWCEIIGADHVFLTDLGRPRATDLQCQVSDLAFSRSPSCRIQTIKFESARIKVGLWTRLAQSREEDMREFVRGCTPRVSLASIPKLQCENSSCVFCQAKLGAIAWRERNTQDDRVVRIYHSRSEVESIHFRIF